MSIPELKRSFDALDHAVDTIVRAKKSPAQQVKDFQAAWRRIFGRPVEAPAAEAFLQVKSRAKKGTRRSQKGGAAAALAGAPLDFQTRPGVDGVHGSFPQYLTSGLSFYNTINQEGMAKGCGTENITPNIPIGMGSNKALLGGGVLGTLSDAATTLSNRPFGSSSPPSIGNDFQTYWQGRALGASPQPDQNPGLFK
jgi:hypothetical protein